MLAVGSVTINLLSHPLNALATRSLRVGSDFHSRVKLAPNIVLDRDAYVVLENPYILKANLERDWESRLCSTNDSNGLVKD